ncbi:MAG: glutathione S-transferase family protein [Myxococcota bacterium]|nr:glutathione S-transferase family protein [Myxococcota bacterium]
MKLYWFSSTNPQKVRLALEELELPYELITVDLYKGMHRKGESAERLPRRKVPVLEVDGASIHESGAILAWLGRQHGLWPNTPAEEGEALSLLFLESSAFQDPASAFFWDRVVLPRIGAQRDEERLAKARKKLNPLLDILEGRLESRNWLMGEFSVVDCAYAAWLPVLELDGHPRVASMLERLRARPSWQACQFEY